jgi:predicted ester cyclase
MNIEQNKELIRQLYEECLNKDPECIDTFFAKDYVHHSDRWTNLDEFKSILCEFHAVYSDHQWTIALMVAEDDKVAVLEKIACTGGGEDRIIMATLIYRIHNGQITDSWGYSNSFF